MFKTILENIVLSCNSSDFKLFFIIRWSTTGNSTPTEENITLTYLFITTGNDKHKMTPNDIYKYIYKQVYL